jgi:serine/threonine protein kinase
VSRNGTLKLAGFSLARSFVPPARTFTHEIVTLWYRPPEILLGARTYSLPIDMWSVGAVITEMVTKRPLFPSDSEIDALFKIFRVVGTPTEDSWPGYTTLPDWNDAFPVWDQPPLMSNVVRGFCPYGVDLISRLLRLDPGARLSARQALQHPYVTGLPVQPMG